MPNAADEARLLREMVELYFPQFTGGENVELPPGAPMNLADEARRIRMLAEIFFPLFVNGGADLELTLPNLLALLAANMTEPLGLGGLGRVGGAYNAAALYILAQADAPAPIFAIDGGLSEQTGYFYKGIGQAISVVSEFDGPAIGATGEVGPAIFARSEGSGSAAILATGINGPGIIATSGNGPAALLLGGDPDTVLPAEVLNLRRKVNVAAEGNGSYIGWYIDDVGEFARDEVLLEDTASGGSSRRSFKILHQGNLQTVAEFDGDASATQTSLVVLADGGLRKVKIGAAGTGPGGVGRALYVD